MPQVRARDPCRAALTGKVTVMRITHTGKFLEAEKYAEPDDPQKHFMAMFVKGTPF